jgi:hypothetical protein
MLFTLLNIDVKYSTIKNIIDVKIHKEINNLIEKHKILPICAVCVKEFTKSTYLFMKYYNYHNGNIKYKIILFQLLYIFYLFNKNLGSYNYNNIIIDHLYIKLKHKHLVSTYTKYNNDSFTIKNCVISIKLTGYENSYSRDYKKKIKTNYSNPINDFFKELKNLTIDKATLQLIPYYSDTNM